MTEHVESIVIPTKDAPRVIIACKVMEPEISLLTHDTDDEFVVLKPAETMQQEMIV